MDGFAYTFTAKSGVGKTTHIQLWRELFGDRAIVINGDKPIVRFDERKEPIVYDTPWCGKEGMNQNIYAPLKAICFLERHDTNRIYKMSEDAVLNHLFQRILIPEDRVGAEKLLEYIDMLVNSVPIFGLQCNVSVEAAKVAYEGIRAIGE